MQQTRAQMSVAGGLLRVKQLRNVARPGTLSGANRQGWDRQADRLDWRAQQARRNAQVEKAMQAFSGRARVVDAASREGRVLGACAWVVRLRYAGRRERASGWSLRSVGNRRAAEQAQGTARALGGDIGRGREGR